MEFDLSYARFEFPALTTSNVDTYLKITKNAANNFKVEL